MSWLEKTIEDPGRFKVVKNAFYALLAVIALAEVVVPRFFEEEAPHFSFENFPFWGSLYGFISCVVIIIVSKFLGKVWLSRRENFYDR